MTLESTHVQTFAVDAETYWREVCLSLAFQERLYKEALGCTRMEVLEREGDAARPLKRKLRFEKPIEAPALVRKLFGSAVEIREESSFDPAARRWEFRMCPPVLGDHIEIRGVVTLADQGASVEQRSVVTVRCSLLGVGSVIERFVAKSTEEGNADKAAFTRRYLSERGLTPVPHAERAVP